jgi:hypothetical protein
VLLLSLISTAAFLLVFAFVFAAGVVVLVLARVVVSLLPAAGFIEAL